MNIRSIRIAVATVLVAAVAGGFLSLGGASVASGTQSVKEKAAISVYAKTMAQARTHYLAAIKPSQNEVLVVGKSAEAVRRAKVKAAWIAFISVANAAKAPSIKAEKSYKAAAAKLAANPNNASLQAAAKASLLTLTTETAALKVDARVAVARATFSKARAAAMAQFKATLAHSIKVRSQARLRAMVQFKAVKVKALADLKAAIKAAQVVSIGTPTKP